MDRPSTRAEPRVLGRYLLCDEIASGGMATVHLGRLRGPVGFSRTVAIKRLHAQFAKDPEFVTMFLDEARTAARVRHPNVVPTVDVVAEEGELFLVMEYVPGESLAQLLRLLKVAGKRMPLPIVSTLMSGVLLGLHAAHEAKNEQKVPLGIVHRDVSPQNILVGTDGIARVLDFGVAKAVDQSHSTLEGQLKGKLPYMSPEHVRAGAAITRKTDIFSASVVLWEMLTGIRLFRGETSASALTQILDGAIERPTMHVHDLPRAVDSVVMRGLARDPAERFETALDMAKALERAAGAIASQRDVGEWVERIAGDRLERRARRVAEVESMSGVGGPDSRPQPIPSPPESWPSDVSSAPPSAKEPSFSSQVSSVVAAHGPESMAPRNAQPAGGTLAAVGVAAAVATAGLVGWLLMRGAPDTSGAPADSPAAASAPAGVEPAPPVAASLSVETAQTAAATVEPPPAVTVLSPPSPAAASAPAAPPVAPKPRPAAPALPKKPVAAPAKPPPPPPASPPPPKPAPLPLHGRE